MRSFKTEVVISPFGTTIVALAVGSGEDDNIPLDVGGQGESMLEDGMGSLCLSFDVISREEL